MIAAGFGMKMDAKVGATRRSRWLLLASATALSVGLAACGSSSGTGAAAANNSQSSSASSSESSSMSTSSGSAAGLVISSANIAGFGTVLVNSSGRTIYILSSEKGGKITCTDANGCTKVWPDTSLPAGVKSATAGPGVNASLLGTVKGADGELYVTYGGYPLYTFARDTASGQVNGEGITSFGGTWHAMGASGNPVMAAASSSTTGAPSYSGGGY
jgi:predicted lipoprotein with Yx(FWY)xxD motif